MAYFDLNEMQIGVSQYQNVIIFSSTSENTCLFVSILFLSKAQKTYQLNNTIFVSKVEHLTKNA